MANSAELQQRRAAAVPRGVSNATAIYAKRAKNAEIWSEDGKRYIDFGAGIAVVNTGHQHPRIVAAVEEQMKAFSHVCFQVTPYESYVRLAERLNALAPVASPAKTMLISTGAEAVENAVKVARAFTGRPGIVSFSGGFHGRTHHGHGADRQGGALQEGLRAVSGRCLQRRLSQQLSRRQRRAEPRGAEGAVQISGRPLEHRRDHHRAGAGRGRLLHRAVRFPAELAGAVRRARHPARSPTKSRRASRAPARCSRSSIPASRPTS